MAIVPRGTRNNNPGNLRHSNDAWRGMSRNQTDDSFVQFDTPHFGIRAATRTLRTYYRTHNLDTVRGIVNRYAPAADNNDTEVYITSVSKGMKVQPDDILTVTEPKTMRSLLENIFRHEGTKPGTYDDVVFDSAMRSGLGLPPALMTASIDSALDKQPDTVAKNIELSETMGMTLEQLENLDPSAVSDQVKKNEIELAASISPATAEFLVSSSAMALSHDSVEELTIIEDTINVGRGLIAGPLQVFGGTLRGLGDLNDMGSRAIEEFYEAAGLVDMQKAARLGMLPMFLNPSFRDAVGEGLKVTGEAIGELQEVVGVPQGEETFASDVAGGVGQVAAHITIAILSGGAGSFVSGATLFAQGIDIQSEKLKAAGVDEKSDDASLAKLGGGATTAISERLGLKLLMKTIPSKLRGRIFRMLASFGSEATQEILEGVSHNLIALGLYDPNQQILEDAPYEGLVGGTTGALVALVTPSRSRGKTIRSSEVLKKAHNLIKESKLKSRSPEHSAKHTAIVMAEAGIRKVFIPINKVLEYAKKHEDGADVALRQLGITEEVEINDKGELEVEGTLFATNILGTKNYDALGDDVRLESDGLSANESATSILDNADAILEQVEVAETLTAEETERKDITPALKGRVAALLNQVKQMSPKEVIEAITQAPADVTNVIDGLVAEIENKAEDTNALVRKLRGADINREIKEIDKEIVNLDKEIGKRIDKDQPIVALDAKVARLEERKDSLISEQESLEKTEPTKKTVRIKGSKVKAIETKTTKSSIAAVRRGFKRGRAALKVDAKSARKQFQQIIKQSGVKNQAKFLKRLVGLDSTEQLNKILPKLEAQLVEELERQQRKELLSEITEQLKTTKSKAKDGKFDPDTQALLDTAREVNSMSRKEAAFELDEALKVELPSPEAVWRNQLLAIAAQEDTVTNDDIRDVLSDIVDLKAEGKAAALTRIAKLKKEVESTRETMIAATLQGKPIKREDNSTVAKRITNSAKRVGAFGSSLWNAWDDTLDIIFNKKGVDGRFIQKLTITRELLQVRIRIHKWQTQMNEKAIEIYGLKNQKEWQNKLYDDNVVHVVGNYVNARGETREMALSRAEARDLWMKMTDPEMAVVLLHSKGNGYTEDILREVFYNNENTKLSEQDKRWAEAQIEFYKEIDPEINAVHRNLYGVNKAFNPRFSPTQTDRGFTSQKAGERQIGDDSAIIDEQSNRKRNKEEDGIVPQMLRSDTQVMHRYVHEVSHFIETAEKVRLLRHTFLDRSVVTAIKQNHTDSTNKQIRSFIDDFSRGYVSRGRSAEQFIGYFNRNFARSVLGLKATIGLKQTTSVFAMGENIPITDFIAGMFHFMGNPKKNIKAIYAAMPSLATRGNSLDLELAKLGQVNQDILKLQKTGKLDDLFTIMIKWGDRVPIYLGAHSRARYQMKQGKSFADSIAESEILAERTQQSVQLDQLSDLQRMGPIGRTITMFMTARLALLRGELKAVRQFKRGKISPREFGKRLAYYHIIMPAAISMIAAGMSFDEDDFIKSVVLGQWTSFVLFGDVLETAVLQALGDDVWDRATDLPIVEIINDARRGATELIESGATVEGFFEAMDELTDVLGAIIGKPIKGAKSIIIGAYQIFDTDESSPEGVRRVLGYSEKIAKEASARSQAVNITF